MWGNKKSNKPQTAAPEPRNLQTNEPPRRAKALWEGTPTMSQDSMGPTGATADRATARLGSGMHVKGEISGNEDLYIDGTVEGGIQLGEGKLTVGTTAKLVGDIIARDVVVFGNVQGNVRAKDRIEIKKDGAVNGDLTTPQIMIEDGAYFKGSIEIERSTEKAADKTRSASA
jgi:cytoskeletal protein CcmA (bactofilin family)